MMSLLEAWSCKTAIGDRPGEMTAGTGEARSAVRLLEEEEAMRLGMSWAGRGTAEDFEAV